MIARVLYEIRWWHWFLKDQPLHRLYESGSWHLLDDASRRVIIERWWEKKSADEPTFRGAYPHRKKA